MGINGVALSTILVEVAIFGFLIYHLFKKMKIQFLIQSIWRVSVEWKILGNISLGIVIESTIKNLSYLTMVVGLLNTLGVKETGGYYLAMHLFWSFLLFPIIALSDTLKVLIANHSNDLKKVKSLLKFAVGLGIVFLFTWPVLIPILEPVLNFLNKDTAIVEYAKTALLILWIPYTLMAINFIIDSLFYGLGKTKFLAIQSIITNLSVYLTGFLLYKNEIWVPTFHTILLLFTLGIAVDSLITFINMQNVIKNKN